MTAQPAHQPAFDLKQTVQQAANDMISSGKLAALVEKHIEDAVSKVFEEQFSWRSPFRESLDQAMKAALNFSPEDFDIQRYNLLVRTIVQRQVDAKMNADFAAQLDKLLEKAFDTPAPEEIKLSELVAKFVAANEHNDDRDGAEKAHVKWEASEYGGGWLDLHPDGKQKRTTTWRRNLRIAIDDKGVVYSVSIDNAHDIDKGLFLGRFNEFERFIVQLYIKKSRLIIDDYNSQYQEEPQDECNC
ncbi:MAG: hypothetical protein ACAH80_08635 [Alphaproteobacteria bacterium]